MGAQDRMACTLDQYRALRLRLTSLPGTAAGITELLDVVDFVQHFEFAVVHGHHAATDEKGIWVLGGLDQWLCRRSCNARLML